MRFIILIIIFYSCSKSGKPLPDSYIFKHDGEYISVEIPLPKEIQLFDSVFIFGCPPDSYNFMDTVNGWSIFISPTSSAASKQPNPWLRNEYEQLVFNKAMYASDERDEEFTIPIDNFISSDQSLTRSLQYHTNWRIDTINSVKYVDFNFYSHKEDGWCFIKIRKKYDVLNVVEDYKWARSFDDLKIKIVKPFR